MPKTNNDLKQQSGHTDSATIEINRHSANMGNHWLLVSKKALPAWQLSRKGFPTLNGIHLFRLRTGGPLALSFTMLPACIRSRSTLPEQSLVANLFRRSRGKPSHS